MTLFEKLMKLNLKLVSVPLDIDENYVIACALCLLVDTPKEKLKELYGTRLLEALDNLK